MPDPCLGPRGAHHELPLTTVSSFLLALTAIAARLLPMPLRRLAYRLGPLTRIIRRGLNRIAPSGFTDIAIAAGDLQGARMLLDLHSEKDLWLGTYEPDLQAALRTLAFPGAVAYDIGAHIGYITLLLARAVAPDGQVFAFEPLPFNLARLRRHVELNSVATRVHIIPAAVTDYTGRARLLVHASGAMAKLEGSAGRAETYAEAIDVACLSLDDFVFDQGHPAPRLIKIDIEGGEVKALKGMTRLLVELQPVLLLELHGPEASSRTFHLLTSYHYGLHRLQPDYPALSSTTGLPWKVYVVAAPAGSLSTYR